MEADCASEPLHGPDCAKRTASHIKMKARGVCALAPVQKHATMTRLERKPRQLVVTGTHLFALPWLIVRWLPTATLIGTQQSLFIFVSVGRSVRLSNVRE